MKLLFDQNISYRIISKLSTTYSDVFAIKELHLENSKDIEIWNYSKTNDFTLVTFDSDFFDLATLYGHPPKIVWLRLGNISTGELTMYLENKYSIIKEFIESPQYNEISCLELTR